MRQIYPKFDRVPVSHFMSSPAHIAYLKKQTYAKCILNESFILFSSSKKIRYYFFQADEPKMLDCVSAAALHIETQVSLLHSSARGGAVFFPDID